MKKVIQMLVIILVVIICVFLGYKSLLFGNCNVIKKGFINYTKNLNFDDKATLEYKKSSKYVTFKDLKIKDEYKNFTISKELTDDDKITYGLHDDKKNLLASFWITTESTIVDKIKNNEIVYDKWIGITHDDFINFFNSKNIKNDYELINYVINNKGVKYNYFTSIKELKNNFVYMYICSILYSEDNYATFFDGSVKGYFLTFDGSKKAKVYEAKIIHDDKVYILSFLNSREYNYFTRDNILESLSTVIFE